MDFDEFCKTYNISGLNPQQIEATKRVGGATLLLAVPGSGKTTVIVARTGYLLFCADIPAENILTLTFTVAAANEMKERFIRKFKIPSDEAPTFSTIHSFCVKVINKCQYRKGEDIPKLVPNIEPIVREIAASLISEYPSDVLVRSLCSQITNTKNRMIKPSEIDEIIEEIDFQTFYSMYLNYMDRNHLMDFDDQLIYAHSFLQKYPDILEQYQEQYKYISVDEAQDTSLLQHKIIQLLAQKYGNIFMVGDDDQSIYGFRGAYPQGLMEFSSNYNGAVTLSMETNYRSTASIVAAANKFIKRNKCRYDKNMVPNRTENGDILYTTVDDTKEQYRLVYQRIREALGTDKTLAVLYRNNESVIPIINLLQLHGIKTKYRDDGGMFFSHFIVRDILNFLRFSFNQRDMELFSQIYYKLGLYMPKSMLPAIEYKLTQDPNITIMDVLKTLLPAATQKKASDAAYNFNVLSRITPVSAIELIMDGLGYKKNVINKKVEDGDAEIALISKVNALKGIAQEYKTVTEFLDSITKIQKYKSSASNITLSTIHSSKGLEFNTVIIIDAVQGILPPKQVDNDNPEEDSRLFYVAITRAKDKLEFIIPRYSFGKNISTSEFIKEVMPKEKPKAPPKPARPVPLKNSLNDRFKSTKAPAFNVENYPPGTTVTHKVFGEGVILSIQENGVAIINFPMTNQSKKVDLKICINNGILI